MLICKKLNYSYDYIIIDSAPYLPVHDSSIINNFVDATLYVVRSDYTNLKVVNEFRNILENRDALIFLSPLI